MTELTSLKIEPRDSWRKVDADNPLVCVVTVKSKETSVETVLPQRSMHQLLALVRGIVSEAAAENVNAFCEVVAPHIGAAHIEHDGETP